MKNFLFILIILLAFFIRSWELGKNSFGFFADEASNGLSAYKIFKTGKDQRNKPFPIIFEAVGDYRDPVYIYSMVPSVAIFGLSEFSVRIVSVFYGVGAVILIYFFAKELGGDRLGLFSALLLAVLPWHVHFSRVGFQLIAAVFWIIFSLLFLYISLKNIKYYPLAAVGLILSFFSYSTTKLYIIPLVLLFLLFNFKKCRTLVRSKFVWAVSITSIILVLLLIFPYFEKLKFFSRWNQVKTNITAYQLSKAYLNHFSIDFLFAKGDSQFPGQEIQRHSLYGLGELHWFQLPLLVISLLGILFRNQIKKRYGFILLFLLIYPLGSLLTSINPQATRSILGIIPFTILSAVGMQIVFSHLRNKAVRISTYIIFCLIIVVSVFQLIKAEKDYPYYGSDHWGWQYGYRPVLEYFSKRQKHYDELIITHRFNAAQELMDFYKIIIDCNKCRVMNNPIKIDRSKRQLFALRWEDLQDAKKFYPKKKFIVQNYIYLPDGRLEFFIGEFN